MSLRPIHLPEELKAVRWVIRLRWIGIVTIFFGSVFYYLINPYNFSVVLNTALVVSIYNLIAHTHLRLIERRGTLFWPAELKLNLNLPILFDIVIVALAIYYTGGVESALVPFYLVLLPAAGLVLPRPTTFLMATISLALLGGIFFFEYTGELQHQVLTGGRMFGLYLEKDYIASILLFQASFLYLGAYIAGYIRTQLQKTFDTEWRARRQSEAIRKMAAALGSTLELNQILHLALKHLRELVTCEGASISLFDQEVIRMTSTWGDPDPVCPLTNGTSWAAYPVIDKAVKEQRPLFDWDADLDTRPAHEYGIRSRVVVPLIVRNDVKGIMKVHGRRRAMFDDKEVASIQSLAGHLALAIENARLYERTRQMALTDGLTGLYNRHHFYQELEREILRSKRHHHKMSLLMCDLDKFKNYNDKYGHVAGDELLRDLASVITGLVRKSDISFRYGGEEFALILPETPHLSALELAERLRRSVEQHPFVLSKSDRATFITLSIGVATYPDQALDVEGLVDAADRALFAAKESRNSVSALPMI
jgi:diguanylate cyclase (GGDEF)-like protein